MSVGSDPSRVTMGDYLGVSNRIVEWDEHQNKLQLNLDNLTRIVNGAGKDPSLEKLPVGIIAVLGESDQEGFKSFWTKLLIHYYQANGLGWLNYVRRDEGKGTREVNDGGGGREVGGGLYLWPTPFVTEGSIPGASHEEGRGNEFVEMLVWIVYLEKGGMEGSMEVAMEMLGALISSRVVEVLQESHVPRLFHSFELIPPHLEKNLCTSLSCIFRTNLASSGQLTFLKKLSKWDDIHNLLGFSSFSSPPKQPVHVAMAMVQGTHRDHSLASIQSALLKVANAITDVKTLSPKKLEKTGEWLTLSSFGNYLDSLTNSLNGYLPCMKILSRNCVESKEEESTPSINSIHQDSAFGQGMENAGIYPKLDIDLEVKRWTKSLRDVGVQTEDDTQQGHCTTCQCTKNDIPEPMQVDEYVRPKIDDEKTPQIVIQEPVISDQRSEKALTLEKVTVAELHMLETKKEPPPRLPPPQLATNPIICNDNASFSINLANNLYAWVAERMTTDNAEEMLQIYKAVKQNHPSKNDDFDQDVIEQIKYAVEQFCAEVKNKFENLVCFTGKRDVARLESFLKMEYENAMYLLECESRPEEKKFQQEIFYKSYEKLAELFKSENQEIRFSEQSMAKELRYSLYQLYLEKMEPYFTYQVYWDASKLFQIHQNLVRYSIQVLGDCMEYPGKVNDVISSEAEILEDELNAAFKNLKARQTKAGGERKKDKKNKTGEQTKSSCYHHQVDKMLTYPLIIYLTENCIYLALPQHNTVSVPALTGIYTKTGAVLFGEMCKKFKGDISKKRSINELLEDSSITWQQEVQKLLVWLKDEARTKLGWSPPSSPYQVLIIIPDWFSQGMQDVLREAKRKAGFSLEYPIISESMAGAIAMFEESLPNRRELSMMSIISECGGRLQISFYEKDLHDRPTSAENPIKLVAKASGNFDLYENSQHDSGMLGLVKNLCTQVAHHRPLSERVDIVHKLFYGAVDQLIGKSKSLPKQVFLLCHSKEWNEAGRHFLHGSGDKLNRWQDCQDCQSLLPRWLSGGVNDWAQKTVINAAFWLISNCGRPESIQQLFLERIAEKQDDLLYKVEEASENSVVSGASANGQWKVTTNSTELKVKYGNSSSTFYTTALEEGKTSSSHITEFDAAAEVKKQQLLQKCEKMKEQIDKVIFNPEFLKMKAFNDITMAEAVAKEKNVKLKRLQAEEEHLDYLVTTYNFNV